MPLQKTPVSINFARGLDTKTDPNQVSIGNFLAMNNSVFTTGGRLTKRNGFKNITNLPNALQTNITTFNNNLVATGSNLYAYSADSLQWLDKGVIQPVQLSTLALVHDSYYQTSPDSAVSSSGLICSAFMQGTQAYVTVSDSETGQQILVKTALVSSAANPRVVVLGNYFIVTFTYLDIATPKLAYVAINTMNPTVIGTVTQISASLSSATTGAYDTAVMNNAMYIAWAGADTTIKRVYLSSTLVLVATQSTGVASTPDYISIAPDIATTRLWITYAITASTSITTTLYNNTLTTAILGPTVVSASSTIAALSSIVVNSVNNIFYEIINTYPSAPFPANTRTDYVQYSTVTYAGVVVNVGTILRSVGLASKPFISENTIYMLVTYADTNTNQPTYFLIDSAGSIYMRLAASNGGGYAANQVLPQVSTVNSSFYTVYLIKDFLTGINKETNLPSGTPTNAIYSQTGVNLLKFTINDSNQYSSEIATSLHLTGGQMWQYDGIKPVEEGFQVWPENVVATWSAAGGSIVAKPDGSTNTNAYFYQFTYEWTDGAGNLQRSAPSIPVSVTTTGAGTTGSITLEVPTLRLTYKDGTNPVRIVGYRWSVAQQVFYQFTSVTNPTLNDKTVDYVTIVDTKSDAQILGNAIIYTTGGVVENIAPPAAIASALFKNRLFIVDAEDRNLLWFSKQVIENVPVEMSDLFTVYVAPTTGSQGSTGPITAISAMDDKLIIFKSNAIYYLTGSGPDNTGANNDFSEAIYITSSVGCSNPSSIVLTPNGVMFQSDKGIWLLGRDLSTTYVGAAVEAFNSSTVTSALLIPGATQVRFTVSNNTTLMFDYFYNQWGTFSNLQAIAACLYGNNHTYLSAAGGIYQETVGTYFDGSSPVLMGFTTSWINIGGLQGFERFYFGYLLGTYYTPFKLNLTLAYDYAQGSSQSILITPSNNPPTTFGSDALFGNSPVFGGSPDTNVFEERFFPIQQKCESFQVSIQEVFDYSFGSSSGQGLTLSGLNLVVGTKRGFRTQSAKRSAG